MNGPGQFRIIILGRDLGETPDRGRAGAGRLLWIDAQDEDPEGIRYWVVEDLASGEERIVAEWDIGRKLNEMEVLAHASKD